MCEVTTILTIATAAASATAQAQQQRTVNTNARREAEAANTRARIEQQQLARQTRERRLAHARDSFQEDREFRRQRARAETSAAEGGVRGTSVDALLSQIDRQAAEGLNIQGLNADALTAASQDSAQNIFNTNLSAVNSANAALGTGFNVISTGLSGLSDAANISAKQNNSDAEDILKLLSQGISKDEGK